MTTKTEKVSYFQVRLFRLNAENYLKVSSVETKFKYALEKMLERTVAIEKKWIERVSDIEIDNAATGENDVVLFTVDERGNRTYSFTKEGLRKKDKTIESEFNAEESNEIEPFYIEQIPEEISEGLRTIFTPFVIKK